MNILGNYKEINKLKELRLLNNLNYNDVIRQLNYNDFIRQLNLSHNSHRSRLKKLEEEEVFRYYWLPGLSIDDRSIRKEMMILVGKLCELYNQDIVNVYHCNLTLVGLQKYVNTYDFKMKSQPSKFRSIYNRTLTNGDRTPMIPNKSEFVRKPLKDKNEIRIQENHDDKRLSWVFDNKRYTFSKEVSYHQAFNYYKRHKRHKRSGGF